MLARGSPVSGPNARLLRLPGRFLRCVSSFVGFKPQVTKMSVLRLRRLRRLHHR